MPYRMVSIVQYMYSMCTPCTHQCTVQCTGQAGRGSGRLLGKDDRAFGRLHEFVSLFFSAVTYPL